MISSSQKPIHVSLSQTEQLFLFPPAVCSSALAKSGTCANFSGAAREGETHKTEIARRSYCLNLENRPQAIQPLLVLARFLTLFKEAQIEVHTPLSWIYWRSSKACVWWSRLRSNFKVKGYIHQVREFHMNKFHYFPMSKDTHIPRPPSSHQNGVVIDQDLLNLSNIFIPSFERYKCSCLIPPNKNYPVVRDLLVCFWLVFESENMCLIKIGPIHH